VVIDLIPVANTGHAICLDGAAILRREGCRHFCAAVMLDGGDCCACAGQQLCRVCGAAR
jgi:hypothetical protein